MLGAGQTLIQKTFSRLSQLIPTENIFILTNEKYSDLVLGQLPMVGKDQILLEPAMRNTAPCILYASLKIKKLNKDALIVVAPSDHWIEDENAFSANLEQCFDYSKSDDNLITLGIRPTFPNTGYGYIEFNQTDSEAIKKVSRFVEKPAYEQAKAYFNSGNYLWNGGIFIWSASAIIEAFARFQPEMTELFMEGLPTYNTPDELSWIKENYAKAENISIDYAVMEEAENVYVLPATFDWNDLGTWSSLYDKLEKDSNENAIINATAFTENASNNIIRSSNQQKKIVVDGLDNYIIVDWNDVLLIYPRDKEQDIKKIASLVK